MYLKFAIAAVVVLAAGTATIAVARPENAARVVTGFASRMACSKVFVSGLDPKIVFDEFMQGTGGSWLVRWALDQRIDQQRKIVETTMFGGATSRARFRDGLGCRTDFGDEDDAAAMRSTLPPKHKEDQIVATREVALDAALARLFVEDGPQPKFTKAVVVMKNGRIIGERYAADHTVDTPVMGFSATKSVFNALTGVLVRDERLSLYAPAPVAAWQNADDPRRAITIDHLLRHTSGLALRSTLHASLSGAWVPSNRMKFAERDMAGFAMSAKLEVKPGTVWNYSDGNSVILSRILRDTVGGRAEDVLRFAERELFAPLGMRNVTIEYDATGTPEGSSQMLATPRDWARFGQLYLNDGVIAGRRILPSGWVAYSATPTEGTFVGYGAGFWTNHGVSWGAEHRIKLGMPGDAIHARGQFGQYVVIVPSEQLVVARFGVTGGMNDVEGVSRLVADVIAATKDKQARATMR